MISGQGALNRGLSNNNFLLKNTNFHPNSWSAQISNFRNTVEKSWAILDSATFSPTPSMSIEGKRQGAYFGGKNKCILLIVPVKEVKHETLKIFSPSIVCINLCRIFLQLYPWDIYYWILLKRWICQWLQKQKLPWFTCLVSYVTCGRWVENWFNIPMCM